ncbi:hypothetical protein EBME_1684 [bacterium endosymbiont of Mortierella elongata FMR23-6]|nr:hypothetical protein EBME_1684 [bacterium endosymbiont of Mortierella elongata FMR23-6]
MTIEELKSALKMEKSKQSIAMTTILRLELLKKRVLRQ